MQQQIAYYPEACLEMNPVKAYLLERPENYVWSSCRANISGKGDAVVSGQEWLDGEARKEYRKFLRKHDSEKEQKIRQATSTGRPLGSEGFIKKLERKLSRRLLPGKAGRPHKAQAN